MPGRVERQLSVNSPSDSFVFFEPPPPHKLSEDEVNQLDQDCMERFIKLKVKHITDGQVRGFFLSKKTVIIVLIMLKLLYSLSQT